MNMRPLEDIFRSIYIDIAQVKMDHWMLMNIKY